MSERSLSGERILVTGGSGFVGVYAALEARRRGAHVVVADLRPPSGRLATLTAGSGLEFARLDMTDRQQTRELIAEASPTAVVHAAAIVSPVQLLEDPELAADVNIMGTANVIGAAARSEVRRLVYLSSISVLPRPQGDPIGVDHPVFLAQHGPGGGFYGASKIAGEAFCHAAIDGLQLDCSIVRPSAVYGFGMSWGMGIKELIESVVATGTHRVETSADVPRDFTYVRDVASLIGALLSRRALRQRCFYAATGRDLVTLRDVAATVSGQRPGTTVSFADVMTDDDHRESSYRGRLEVHSQELAGDWSPKWPLAAGIDEYMRLEDKYAQPHAPETKED